MRERTLTTPTTMRAGSREDQTYLDETDVTSRVEHIDRMNYFHIYELHYCIILQLYLRIDIDDHWVTNNRQ